MIIRFLQQTGRAAFDFLASMGRIAFFTASAIRWTITPPYYGRQLLRQIIDIGYYSLPVVGLTTLFSGMVLALQSYTGFARFSAEDTVATVVVLSVTRELGPVLAGLMVAGRIGASMAAEIGTMRVTDQIDALDTLSTRPMQYLVAPRLLAGTICLPFLVLVGDIIGVFGGYIVGVYRLGFNASLYLSRTLEFLEFSDVMLWFFNCFDGVLSRLSFRSWRRRCRVGYNQCCGLFFYLYFDSQLPRNSFIFWGVAR